MSPIICAPKRTAAVSSQSLEHTRCAPAPAQCTHLVDLLVLLALAVRPPLRLGVVDALLGVLLVGVVTLALLLVPSQVAVWWRHTARVSPQAERQRVSARGQTEGSDASGSEGVSARATPTHRLA